MSTTQKPTSSSPPPPTSSSQVAEITQKKPHHGRKKGTPNKRTVWLRDTLNSVDFHWELEFKKAYSKFDKDRLDVLLAMLPYLSPKAKDKDIPDESAAAPTVSQAPAQEQILQVVANDPQ